MSERIENLRTAIETMPRCKAAHERCATVVQRLGQKTIWEGVVESFALTRHPKAKSCYAWSYRNKGETQYVNVLKALPAITAQTAVRAAIIAETKEEK